jgi:hypothetical protein
MEQKLMQVAMGVVIALMGWNFKTLNDMQLRMETVMYKYANLEDINDMKISIKELQWRLGEDAMMK